MVNYNVQSVDFPDKVLAALAENKDGSATIYVNANLPPEERQNAIDKLLKEAQT